jgi:hypothetical protein
VLAEDEFGDAEITEKIFYPEIERVLQKMFSSSKIAIVEHVVCRSSVVVVQADETTDQETRCHVPYFDGIGLRFSAANVYCSRR